HNTRSFAMTEQSHRRRRLVALAKLSLAVGILGYLVYRLRGEDVFQRFLQEPKNWSLLGIAQLVVATAFSLSFIRWYLLVRALGLEFHLRDAFRLGSLGFMLNQVSLGSIGGDFFKAVCVAREFPGKRTEAVATVFVDRVVGLYAMIIVALCGAMLAWSTVSNHPTLRALATVVAAAGFLGTIGVAVLMTHAATGPAVRNRVAQIPVAGHTLARLVAAAAVYRERRRYVVAATGIACCTHTLLLLGFWIIGRGLPGYAPPLSQMCLVAPMSMVAGALPLTPAGLGTFETAMEFLYRTVGARDGDGTLAAITYRVMTYVFASIGAVYYISARGKVDRLLHDAEDLADELDAEEIRDCDVNRNAAAPSVEPA
ncbi:MAG: lysylphosphatidylglycerol synthase transmembrane domain-containing protein, partial [Planctomycetota bacterium]